MKNFDLKKVLVKLVTTLLIVNQKKNKNSESKVISDTHLKRNIFNKNRLKHEKDGKQFFCSSGLMENVIH